MVPLSKLLNSMFPKVQIPINEKRSYCTNHLLFIDDLKIMAERESTVQIITNETKRFFSIVGLEINTDKSATNSLILVGDSVLLTNNDCYKYLGIIEDKSSRPTRTNWELITSKIKAGVNKLCDTNLHGRNLMRGINEYATSLLNYYIGLLDIEPEKFTKLDHDIRQILITHRIHLQPACKERLYLPINEMRRGLIAAEFKSELMLLKLKQQFEATERIYPRREAILKVQAEESSHFSNIENFLR